MLALSSTGDIRVALDMRSLISEPAAIDAQGNAYVGMAWGVAAVSPSGQQLWSARSAEPPNWYLHVWARPALSADGTLIVSDDTGAVRGVRDGAVVWSVERESIADHSISDSIAIGPDGTFYGGSLGTSYLYAMR